MDCTPRVTVQQMKDMIGKTVIQLGKIKAVELRLKRIRVVDCSNSNLIIFVKNIENEQHFSQIRDQLSNNLWVEVKGKVIGMGAMDAECVYLQRTKLFDNFDVDCYTRAVKISNDSQVIEYLAVDDKIQHHGSLGDSIQLIDCDGEDFDVFPLESEIFLNL
ncbi:uncharacterized protein LOC128387057 [Panonychus citri]|uniref:uncharacterized protein LOC128387057 n=1 Tax=Panonychus citri TaxID=50023 RepID=UPI0023073BB2|nr:uncharacterized protein LOC128387057 [Panonychus citri]